MARSSIIAAWPSNRLSRATPASAATPSNNRPTLVVSGAFSPRSISCLITARCGTPSRPAAPKVEYMQARRGAPPFPHRRFARPAAGTARGCATRSNRPSSARKNSPPHTVPSNPYPVPSQRHARDTARADRSPPRTRPRAPDGAAPGSPAARESSAQRVEA